MQYITVGVPGWEKSLLNGLASQRAVAFLRRSLKIDDAGVERSRQKIEDTFARVEQIIGDGRRYLTGDRFTVADLTFASLAAPVLVPPGHPVQTFDIDLFPDAARDQIRAWRARPAGRFALRLYADERSGLSARCLRSTVPCIRSSAPGCSTRFDVVVIS